VEGGTAKAPGKILWIGGYAVLERPCVSYVTTVDAFIEAEVERLAGEEVRIIAPEINRSGKGSVDPATGKVSMDCSRELELARTAADVACSYISSKKVRVRGFELRTKSAGAFSYKVRSGKVSKSGLGSSAAVSVAVVNAILKAFGIHYKLDEAHKLAQIAHSLANGKVGSGFDVAAASYGSIIYTRYSAGLIEGIGDRDGFGRKLSGMVEMEWDYAIEPLQLPARFNIAFASFKDRGMETNAAVGSVSSYKRDNPGSYSKLIKEMDIYDRAAVDSLRRMRSGESAERDFCAAFEKGREVSKKLGEASGVEIEPDECTELIEESKENGALVAKLPGAGGRDAIAALSVGEKNHSKLIDFWKGRKELEVIDIGSDNKGVR
jgi:phosphomevalonate kinase